MKSVYLPGLASKRHSGKGLNDKVGKEKRSVIVTRNGASVLSQEANHRKNLLFPSRTGVTSSGLFVRYFVYIYIQIRRGYVQPYP
jgi:hypothetical protein